MSVVTERLSSALSDRYRIERELGAGGNDMQAVEVVTKPAFGILSKQRLFSATGYFVSPWSQVYDVSSDGQQFLMMRVGSASGAVAVSLVLVQNFLDELTRKVP